MEVTWNLGGATGCVLSPDAFFTGDLAVTSDGNQTIRPMVENPLFLTCNEATARFDFRMIPIMFET